jgi:fumarylacetoacetase
MSAARALDGVAVMKSVLDPGWTWKSWISSANEPACGFPLQNLPFCAFKAADGAQHLGIGIGSFILDLHAVADTNLLESLGKDVREASTAPTLNALMDCGREAATRLRSELMHLLRMEATADHIATIRPLLHPLERTIFCKPVSVGNYSDFYASIHHATNVGRLFRPDDPLLPNYKFVPIGYHGRASSLVISGTSVVRPHGQTRLPSADSPIFGPCRQLDYELEVGAYIGSGNVLGQPIDIEAAERHIFGIGLVNDWSARDIQAWEYQPLGPFLGKSFATSISPWVVTIDALAPFRVPIAPRPDGDPVSLPYLTSSEPETAAIDLKLEVHISTAAMRKNSLPAARLSSANLRDIYWSFAQMVTHHTSNGCNLISGDLIASGTISGPDKETQGSLLEITSRGTAPLQLPNGELRSFLEDGDEIVISGFCERDGLPRIGLGECRGTIAPAFV